MAEADEVFWKFFTGRIQLSLQVLWPSYSIERLQCAAQDELDAGRRAIPSFALQTSGYFYQEDAGCKDVGQITGCRSLFKNWVFKGR